MKIDAIRSEQNGHNIFSAKMTVAELAQVTAVDVADPTIKQKGYQRKGSEKRFDQIAAYLIGKHAIMPPPIIMSYRGTLSQKHLKGGFVELEIPAGDKLWVIDGQHRLGGLKLLAGLNDIQGTSIPSKKYIKYHGAFSDYEMPVVIIECASRAIEAAQFATINGKAKKVDIFLATSAMNQGGGAAPTGEDAWRARAADAVHFLSNSPNSKLRGKIKHPTAGKGQFYCTAKGLMNMMKPIMNDGIYAAIWEKSESDKEKICLMLQDYWAAWHSVIPFCFDDPKNFALFNNSGLMAVHICLLTMIRRIGTDFPTVHQFKSVINQLEAYCKDTYWHKNAQFGINRCIGESQIKREADKIVAKIASINIPRSNVAKAAPKKATGSGKSQSK